MENRLARTSIPVETDDKGVASEKEYEKYKQQTRGEYEELMKEFEFRCRRAAMMNYFEASGYDKKIYVMEFMAAFVGTISATSVGMMFIRLQTEGLSLAKLGQLGGLGLLGIGAALIIQFLGKGSTKIIPSFSKRVHSHIAAGAAWQRLAQKTRSYRIQLDNPRLDIPEYAAWYNDIIQEREKLCTMVSIPQSTYILYSNPKRVFDAMKQRRLMFLQFLDLESMDADDFDQSLSTSA